MKMTYVFILFVTLCNYNRKLFHALGEGRLQIKRVIPFFRGEMVFFPMVAEHDRIQS